MATPRACEFDLEVKVAREEELGLEWWLDLLRLHDEVRHVKVRIEVEDLRRLRNCWP